MCAFSASRFRSSKSQIVDSHCQFKIITSENVVNVLKNVNIRMHQNYYFHELVLRSQPHT